MEKFIPSDWQLIFKIGELDFSPNEFALAPSEAKRFKERFPQDPVYTVGQSHPSDFPFIHPNAMDTVWGGEPYHKFIIKFPLGKIPKGEPLLFIALYDAHEALAPLMDVFLNGEKIGTLRVNRGRGRAFFGEEGEEQFLALPLKKENFRVGENEIAIALHSGSWIAYDAIMLFEIPEKEVPHPRERDYPLSLYRRIAPFELKSNGICFTSDQVLHLLLPPGGYLEIDFPLSNADFEIEGDVYLPNGALELSYTFPEEAMGNQWTLALPAYPRWMHFYIHNFPEKVLLKLSTESGKLLKEEELSHPPAPYGKVRIGPKGTYEFYLANFFYRPPIKLKLDKIAYKEGDIAVLHLDVPHHGYLDMEISLISPKGKEIEKKTITLAPLPQQWDEYFLLRKGLKDGEYKIRCAIYSPEILWEGNISLVVDGERARKAKEAIKRVESEGICPLLLIEEAKSLFLQGDFTSVLSLLNRERIRKEGRRYCLEKDGEIIIGNDYLELGIRIKDGFGPFYLLDKRSGYLFADSPYLYQLNDQIKGTPELESFREENGRFSLAGRVGDVEIKQEFYVPEGKPYFEERITVKNKGSEALSSPNIAFGFLKKLKMLNGNLLEGWGEWRVVAVPYRRPLQGTNEEYEDYPFEELLWRKGWYRPIWTEKRYTEEWGGEGWVLTNHKFSLLIAKHNNEAMEYSILKRMEKGGEQFLRLGGAGIWHGDPECAVELSPGEEIRFGTTRYVFIEGDWKDAYYAFREFMEENGHKVPEDYNPPIHWNELYDNPLWWGPDTPENRKKYYSLPQILEEAEKAKELGCEALYLDPGWDTSFASSIWAEDRLLKAEEFVKLMREKYGLAVSLHTPLAGWSDINAYPYECRRKDAEGNVQNALCGGSELYIKTKAERLIELARAGVVFFMFDGSAFTGECYDSSHGHPIPYTREAHCRAILKLTQLIHKEFPNVLIELHDPILAGVPERYAPTYYLHASPGSFDEVWAFEYMWDPMADILSGRAISLYYYNLAYSLPLYIHIDLRKDNENCLEFWWYASTCRHLGVGGKHPEERIWEAHKKAIREYKRLKDFYTRGEFFGLGETVHIHSLQGKGAVINAFNLGDKPERKYISFKLEDIGLDPTANIRVEGAKWQKQGRQLNLVLDIPAKGTALVEIIEEVK